MIVFSVFFIYSRVLRLLFFVCCNPLLLEYFMIYDNPEKKGQLHCIPPPPRIWGSSGFSSHLPSSPFQLWPLTSAWTSFNMTSCCSSSQEQLMEPRVTHSYSSWDACKHTFGVSWGRILLQKTNSFHTYLFVFSSLDSPANYIYQSLTRTNKHSRFTRSHTEHQCTAASEG